MYRIDFLDRQNYLTLTFSDLKTEFNFFLSSYRNFPREWNLHQHKFQFDSASLGTSALSEVLEQKLGLMDFCSIFAGFLGHS